MTTVYEKFKTITNVDIYSFFEEFISFNDSYYQNIAGYYTRGEDLLSTTLKALDSLYIEAIKIKDTFENFREQLSDTYDFWELLDNFENVFQKIETIKNSQKWFRSNKSLDFNNDTEKDYILKQGQTLWNLAAELGYEDPNDDWTDIALKNGLREEDYDIGGGSKLKVAFQNSAEYKLNSVVDSISGEKVYGLDLDKKITFENEDVKVLSYRDTILQSYSILLNLTKGSNPEFPEDGINKGLIGGAVSSFQYPVIFRQLTDTFGNDDSFIEFSVNDIIRDQDQIFIQTSVKSRIGEVLGQNLKISG